MSPRDSRDPASQSRRGEEAKRKEESSSCSSSSINRVRIKCGRRPDRTREREKRHVMLCNPRGKSFCASTLVGVDPRQRASRRDAARLVERHGSLGLLHRVSETDNPTAIASPSLSSSSSAAPLKQRAAMPATGPKSKQATSCTYCGSTGIPSRSDILDPEAPLQYLRSKYRLRPTRRLWVGLQAALALTDHWGKVALQLQRYIVPIPILYHNPTYRAAPLCTLSGSFIAAPTYIRAKRSPRKNPLPRVHHNP
jgi:hypothetical protein